MRSCLVLVFLVCLLLQVRVVYAHKLKLFATAEGQTISGYAYLSGGQRPKDLTVEIFTSSSEKLGEMKLDENGEFAFTAQYKCDHLVTIDTGDGHGASFVVKAHELPEILPVFSTSTSGDLCETSPEASSINDGGQSVSLVKTEELIAKTLSKQVRPLREQIERLEEKIRLRDIMGGIGYIFGITGVVFYFLGVRKAEKTKGSTESSRD